MSGSEASTTKTTQHLPRFGTDRFPRTSAGAALACAMVCALAGCTISSTAGSVHFEGRDATGVFSSDVGAWGCHARLGAAFPFIYFGGNHDKILISGFQLGVYASALAMRTGVHPDLNPFVQVETRRGSWSVHPSECRTYDVRNWFDAERHLHVVVVVDCTSADGVRVHGSVQSDACSVERAP